VFGSRDEKGLFFEWKRLVPREKAELSYLKVFATTEWTEFSSLMQEFRSSTEELDVKPPVEPRSRQQHGYYGSNVRFGGGLASWTTLRFTIVRTLI